MDDWNKQRLHHAWLITGIRSVGKNGVAHCLARFLLSKRQGEQGTIQEFHTIDYDSKDIKLYFAKAHPNFIYISAQTEKLEAQAADKKTGVRNIISMESARKITKFFALSGDENQFRVVIIDSLDEMNPNATNAILKILEEPPARTVFLLISHNPTKLLPTIISRCRRLPLQSLSEEAILSLLPEDLPDNQRQIIPWLAQGSAGQALFFLEPEKLELWNQSVQLFTQITNKELQAIPLFIKQFERSSPQIKEKLVIFLQFWMRLLHAVTLVSAGQQQRLPASILSLMEPYAHAPLENCLNMFDKSHKLSDAIIQEMQHTPAALSQLCMDLYHINP